MNFFSNKTNETQVGNPTEPNSGSEQDRYNAHFGVGDSGLDALKKFAQAKGVGAEQDRYGAHFGVEQEKVQAAAASILSAKGEGAEQDRHASHFGLGNDGWQKAKQLAAAKGTGAEQARDHCSPRSMEASGEQR